MPESLPLMYIDPEETVTDVRQKIEQHPLQQITLVIPPQTQMQGIISWKLLARYAQTLGKAISILSSNSQVQGWARSVGFQVEAGVKEERKMEPRRPVRAQRRGTA